MAQHCPRIPCPHCVLGVVHAAGPEAVATRWQQILTDYAASDTQPDSAYWMRLMACQWICSMPSVSPETSGATGKTPLPRADADREFVTPPQPPRYPPPSVPPLRFATGAARGPPPPPTPPPPPGLGYDEEEEKRSIHTDTFSVWRDCEVAGNPSPASSSAAAVAAATHSAAAADAATRSARREPLWQYENDTQCGGGWRSMQKALARHLEAAFHSEHKEATFTLDGVMYYFDLHAMYQENPNTGKERRIRRRVI